MAVGVAVSVSKVAVYSRMTEVNSFYARVVADGGTISDFSALRLAVLDYKAVQSLEPSLYTFASGRKAGTQYSLVPADGSGDLSVTRSGDTAMELNANGFWQPVAANVPRYDYVGGVPMINIEELRTNLLPRYKSFAHSDWTKSGASIQGDPNTAGAELVINGGFNTDTGWIKESGITIVDGVLRFTSTTSSNKATASTISVVAGRVYMVTYTMLNRVAGTLRVEVGSANYVRDVTANGTYTDYIYCTSSGTLNIRCINTSTFDVDNVSVKEVTGYASPFVDANGANLMDGYKLVEGTNNGLHYMRPSSAISIATGVKSISIFAKYDGTRSWVFIQDDNVGIAARGWFNVQNGTIGGGDAIKKITSYADGWYRCEIMYSSSVYALPSCYPVTGDGIASYLGDGTSGILIAHAQLEAGATASSPIGGDEGSAQTRNADVIVKTGASALIGQTEGTIIIQVDLRRLVVFKTLFDLSDDTVNNRLAININVNKIRCYRNSSTQSSATNIEGAFISEGFYKIAFAYKSGESIVYVNGTSIGSSADTFTFSTLSKIVIGSQYNVSGNFGNERIKLVHLGKTRISNEKLIELTTL